MKKPDLVQSITVIANIGVIGGLIFVGVQLALDRRVAEQETLFNAVNSRMYWAELVRESGDVWTKGLADEPLSDVEVAQFDAIATAWELAHYTYYRAQELASLNPSRFVREWALELNMHPGLMKWWNQFQHRMTVTNSESQAGDVWANAVNDELQRGKLILPNL